MIIKVINECGYDEAMIGLGLSYGLTSDMNIARFAAWEDCEELRKRLQKIAEKLAGKGGGHDKFLRQIVVWVDITAPLYWWKEFDTYKIGTVAQSESTMHTLLKNPITQGCFEGFINNATLKYLEKLRLEKDFIRLVNELPQGWLQRRIVSCNYAVLRNIIEQRRGHKLKEWSIFIQAVLDGIECPEFLRKRGGK